MNTQTPGAAKDVPEWSWPLDVTKYDRRPFLTRRECAALASFNVRATLFLRDGLERLLVPIGDVCEHTGLLHQKWFHVVRKAMLLWMRDLRKPFWAWTADEWVRVLNGRHGYWLRQHTTAIAYLLCDFNDLHSVGKYFIQYLLAQKIFGPMAVDAAVAEVRDGLTWLGYGKDAVKMVRKVVCEALLFNRSPQLTDLNADVLVKLRESMRLPTIKADVMMLSRALTHLGVIPAAIEPDYQTSRVDYPRREVNIHPDWLYWCERWTHTSTLAAVSREGIHGILLKAGRWLAECHPRITTPAEWTRETAADFVALVSRMKVGDYIGFQKKLNSLQPVGAPLKPMTQASHLSAVCGFFKDCQEWGWVARRFDPARLLRTPRTIRAQMGTNPRVIADDIWAKLLWAGLNLTAEDLPLSSRSRMPFYPMEMVRALVTVWLFAGLRGNEILRLRVGCVRWQRHDMTKVEFADGVPRTLPACSTSPSIRPTGPSRKRLIVWSARPSTPGKRRAPNSS